MAQAVVVESAYRSCQWTTAEQQCRSDNGGRRTTEILKNDSQQCGIEITMDGWTGRTESETEKATET